MAGVSEPLARMPVRMRSESFYPVQRFLRDSFVRYHRVQRARPKQKRNKAEGRKEEEERDGKRPCGMRGGGGEGEGEGKGEGERERKSNQSSRRHGPPTIFAR